MRGMTVLAVGGMVLLTGAAIVGQSNFTLTAENRPPTDRVKVFSANELREKIASDKAGRLLDGQELFSFNLLHRKTEPATVHGDLVDLYIVQEGSGTLESGGSMIDPKPAAGRTGDLTGTGIRGGTTQVIKKGDVVFIPPGVPHRFVDGDIWYLNAHFPGKSK